MTCSAWMNSSVRSLPTLIVGESEVTSPGKLFSHSLKLVKQDVRFKVRNNRLIKNVRSMVMFIE
ncbi:MAG: hypothetical protein U5L72_18880 [Bacteroidales bacterium]|nr:hypothetical protein [Bacteroidales bacterium]